MNDLAYVKQLQCDFFAAERDYIEAMRIAKEISYHEGIATCIGNLAGLALHRKNWLQAEDLARQALKLSEQLQQKELIAANCRRIAKAYARNGKPQEGLNYAYRAIDIFTQLRQPEELKKAQAALQECGG